MTRNVWLAVAAIPICAGVFLMLLDPRGALAVCGLALAALGVVLMSGRDGFSHPHAGDASRWHGAAGLAQVAGKRCATCAKRIVTVTDGEVCGECHAAVHHGCAVGHAHAHRSARRPYR
jgi:hypothetical protein